MNSIKYNRIKEELMMADQICSDISLDTVLEKAEYITHSGMPEDEIKKFYNRFGEQLALACEHYLKAMIISRMHFEGIDNESEEELNKIFNNRDSQGVAKKYSHYFDKLLTSNGTALLNSSGLQESILIRLAQKLQLQECKEYNNKRISSWFTDDETDYELSKEELLTKIKGKVNANAAAYPESRYGMFTTYRADLQFLTCLCETLQEYPTRTLHNCLFIKSMGRHIYPDDNSLISEKRSDGTSIKYIYSDSNMGKLEIIECNGIKKEELSQDQQFNDMFPNITRSQNAVEISYVENGKSLVVKYDQMLKCFCKKEIVDLQKEFDEAPEEKIEEQVEIPNNLNLKEAYFKMYVREASQEQLQIINELLDKGQYEQISRIIKNYMNNTIYIKDIKKFDGNGGNAGSTGNQSYMSDENEFDNDLRNNDMDPQSLELYWILVLIDKYLEEKDMNRKRMLEEQINNSLYYYRLHEKTGNKSL